MIPTPCPWCGNPDRFHSPSADCTGLELDGVEEVVRGYLMLAKLARRSTPYHPETMEEILLQIAGDRRLPGNVAALLVAELHEGRGA